MAEASASAKKPLPVVDFLKLPDGGDPYLEGHKCQSCGALFLAELMATIRSFWAIRIGSFTYSVG